MQSQELLQPPILPNSTGLFCFLSKGQAFLWAELRIPARWQRGSLEGFRVEDCAGSSGAWRLGLRQGFWIRSCISQGFGSRDKGLRLWGLVRFIGYARLRFRISGCGLRLGKRLLLAPSSIVFQVWSIHIYIYIYMYMYKYIYIYTHVLCLFVCLHLVEEGTEYSRNQKMQART